MRRAEQVFREEEFDSDRQPAAGEPPLQDIAQQLNGVWNNALGEISQDAKVVGQALKTFPYSSALKVVGALTVAYIVFKILGKFGSIHRKLL